MAAGGAPRAAARTPPPTQRRSRPSGRQTTAPCSGTPARRVAKPPLRERARRSESELAAQRASSPLSQ
eukprot:849907-Prorocentrum_minimum.AAC.3